MKLTSSAGVAQTAEPVADRPKGLLMVLLGLVMEETMVDAPAGSKATARGQANENARMCQLNSRSNIVQAGKKDRVAFPVSCLQSMMHWLLRECCWASESPVLGKGAHANLARLG